MYYKPSPISTISSYYQNRQQTRKQKEWSRPLFGPLRHFQILMLERCSSSLNIMLSSAKAMRYLFFTSKHLDLVSVINSDLTQRHDWPFLQFPWLFFPWDGSCLSVEELWFSIPDVYKCQMMASNDSESTNTTSSETIRESSSALTYSHFGNVITQVVHELVSFFQVFLF
jgi:hypothetical protein